MDREPRQRTAALPFILITLFIDILGIGVIVPVLPELVKQLLEAEEIVAADPSFGGDSGTECQSIGSWRR